MFNQNSRKQLFRFGCVPARLLIASVLFYALETDDTGNAKLVTQIYLFTTAFIFTINMIRTILGTKTLGGFGGKVWWNELRYVHIIIYTLTAILVSLDVRYSILILYLDVIIGAVLSTWLQ